jgi:CRP-like cAMP-binding protein
MYDLFFSKFNEKVSLTPEEEATIKTYLTPKKLRKKQYLLQEGDVCRSIAFISAGVLKAYSVDDDGNEHIIQFGLEGWIISDMYSFLTGEPATYNIDAIEDTELVLFTHENFELLCREIPAFNNMVNAILQRSFIAAQNRIQASLTLTAEEKYLNFISKYPGFASRIPQTMIASYLGMTPETLSRIRKQTAKK